MIDVRQGDNRAKLRQMIADGEFVDSVVCDPPYGLVSVTKRFGGTNAAPAKFGTDGAFSRQSRGFMGLRWDSTGIERDPEFWHLVYQVMKPGAYIIAFSSSRTYGYMQVAMEAAGFITHPMFGWVFNTGFPKGHDASKAIDKTLGTDGQREVLAERYAAKQIKPGATVVAEGGYGKQDIDFTATDERGGSPEARQWDGWKTGTQSLKPALEPVYFGQKPFSEKTGALNIMRHGVGAVNIDACRVPMGGEYDPTKVQRQQSNRQTWEGGTVSGFAADHVQATYSAAGRYPANLVHDGSPEVVALFPQSGGQQGRVGPEHGDKDAVHTYGDYPPRIDCEPRGDSGSAARFFNSFPHEGPIMCSPKAGKKDRAGSKHATVKPIGLMRHFIRLVTPPGGLVLDPFAGTGTTGQAALNEGMSCILMEAEPEYARDIRRRFGLPETVSDKLVRLSEALA